MTTAKYLSINAIDTLSDDKLSTYGTILITGGTGRLGKPLLERMAQLGFTIRVAAPDEPLQHPNVEWIPMDFLNDLDFAKTMHGVTHVLHLGAELWKTETMDQINCVATEALVKKGRSPSTKSSSRKESPGNADIRAVETHLGDLLGLKVHISQKNATGAGAVTFEYGSLDQLDMLCQRITGEKF